LNTIRKYKEKEKLFHLYIFIIQGKRVCLFGGEFLSTYLTGNMSAVVAGSSTSFSATFTTRRSSSSKNSHLTHPKTLAPPQCQVLLLLFFLFFYNKLSHDSKLQWSDSHTNFHTAQAIECT